MARGLLVTLVTACAQALLVQGKNYKFASSCYDSPTKSLTMQCGPDEMLRIVRAFYGYNPQGQCSFAVGDCTFEEHQNYACVGRQNCSINMPGGLGRPIPKCEHGRHDSNYFQVEYQCVPAADTHDICRTTELTSQSGYISSPGYPLNYNKEHKCQVSVALTHKQPLTLYIIDMNLRDTAQGCTDDLYIRDDLRGVTICGPRGFEELFTSTNGKMDVTFNAKAGGDNKGFWLYYEAADPLTGEPTTIPTTPTTLKSLLEKITDIPSKSSAQTREEDEVTEATLTEEVDMELPRHVPKSDSQVPFGAIVGGVIGTLCIILTILLVLLLVQRLKERRDMEKKHLPFLDVQNQAFQSNSEISASPSDSMYC